MLSPKIKSKLDKDLPSVGSWVTFTDPSSAEILARAGFDWLAVDMEHSPITLDIAQDLIRVISLCGVCPLVRLGSNDPVTAKLVLDAGANGVIVPMVNSRKEAEEAVAAVKYPPAGRRSAGLARAQDYGPGFEEYIARANSDTLVIVQIEHIDAVNNAQQILSTPGIDAYMIGPYDLSASMGIPGRFADPRMVAALEKVREAGRKAGVPAGIHVVYPRPGEAAARIKEGYRFVAYGTDFLFLGEGARTGLAELLAPAPARE